MNDDAKARLRRDTVGRLLREERESRGVSLIEASLRLGLEPATLEGWETGESAPPLTALLDFADRFGVARATVAEAVDTYQGRIREERERTMAELFARNEALQKKARGAT